MIGTLKALQGIIKPKSYHIDYPLFRLHYRVTVSVLLAYCIILTAKVMFGDVMDCYGRSEGRDDFWDNFCYSHGTYTQYAINNFQTYKPVAKPVLTTIKPPTDIATTVSSPIQSLHAKRAEIINHAFPNEALLNTRIAIFLMQNFRSIHSAVRFQNLSKSSNIRYMHSGILIPENSQAYDSVIFWQHYYQYVPIILFIQAMFFYLPHYIWKMWERGTISVICKHLHDNKFNPNEYLESNYHLIDYIHKCFQYQRFLVFKYYACHLMLVLNILLQILFLNSVFNGLFITYGLDVFHYIFIDNFLYGLRDSSGRLSSAINNPMDLIFPKKTHCSVQILSVVGNRPDGNELFCILPLNILHDKFFLILWFWLVILTVLTVFQIAYDIIYLTIPMFRRYTFKRRFGRCPTKNNGSHLSPLHELFLLDLIGSNSDRYAFSILLRKLSKDDCAIHLAEQQSLV